MASVAVIGGGLTGLSAAFSLRQRGIRVVIYEATERIGGVVKTERRGGYIAELGPNSMTSPPAAVAGLLSELGLDASLVSPSAAARERYVVRRGKLVRLPLTPAELLTTRLLSNTAKLAVFGEPLVERSDSAVDESLAAFVRRRFNQEVVDYILNPFVAGTFAGDPEQLSLRHAMPQLQGLERSYGSVMKGLLKASRSERGSEHGAVGSGLISFKEGLQEIPEAFERELKSEIRYRSPVTQVRSSPRGWTVGAAFQAPETYDGVIYAAPAHSLDQIDLDFAGGERLATLSSIDHPPVAVLALGFAQEQIKHTLDGFGFLVPEVERRRIMGAIFSSTVFPGRAPSGFALLTVFAGGARDPDFVEADPQTITARVLDELRVLLGIRGEPSFKSLQIWPKAIPQYVLGYGRFKDIADQAERSNPGLALAGTFRDGVSLNDVLSSGLRAADRLNTLLGSEPVAGGISAADIE
jgi:protoporphyrinogen/coproporphyrinogen III oxidase